MSKKRILVFGASGMLGRRVVEALSATDTEVVGLRSADCDIAEWACVSERVKAERPDVIINCAAYTAVDKAESDGENASRVNAQGPANLGKAAEESGALLIHVSTDYVFDGTASEPYTEDSPTAPLGVYGFTKRLGEKAVAESGCQYVIVRTQWLYDSTGKNFFLTMLRLFETRDAICVVDDQTGSPTYASDLASAIVRIAENFNGQSGIYHYSNSGECTWYDFAISIAQMANSKTRVSPIPTSQYPTPAKRPSYSVLSKEKVVGTFGVGVPHWRDGLTRCYREWEKCER